MKLYRVVISMPVYFSSYFVLADGFDEAADMAMKREQANGGRNGGIDKIEIVGWAYEREGNLLITAGGFEELSRDPGDQQTSQDV